MPYKDPNDPRKRASLKRSSAKYYEGNKKKAIDANLESRRRNRELWQQFKSGLKCEHCGFSHPAALDFHHIDRTNKKSVNKLASNGMYKQAIQELHKCVVLCANCHRITHHEEKNPAL
jgi:predicted HNH restriction endonuclease